ncbi:MAG TPA: hypothetical protein VIU02_12820 [Burkholderiales bacterium]
MRTPIVLMALLLGALLGACASNPKEVPKYSVAGFTISVPPKDEEWAVIQQTPERLMLGKSGDFTGETLSVLMLAIKLSGQTGDALVRDVRNNERKALDPKRFRILSQDVKPYLVGNLQCAMSTLEVEDRGGSGPTGPVMSLVIESMTLTCPDPAKPTQGVSVSYIHQAYPEDKGKQFVDKAMPILNSLALSEVR